MIRGIDISRRAAEDVGCVKTWDVNGLAQSKSVYDLTGKTINKNNGLVSATGFEPVTV